MNARNILLFIGGILIASLQLTSCGVDRWEAYAERTASQRWINDTMRVWYYWQESIPEDDELNYFSAPFTFFASFLSSEDGKNGTHYSTIDSLKSDTRSIPYTDYSYGFQFTANRLEGSDALCAHILYVAPGSPADEIGLQRGDWILQMDGEAITTQNYTRLYGDEAMTLTVGRYDAESGGIVAYDEPRQIASARTIDDNPVHYHNIYTKDDKRVGYLVYNHFSAGATETGSEYDNALLNVFADFASHQVNEFILDLRYNNGGLVSSAQLLCSLLAPAGCQGQEMGYLEYNEHIRPQQVPFYFIPGLLGEGNALSLRRLYILTSSQTASASEMVINCLRPYMEVVLIGAKTEGKNVGSRTFVNEAQMLTMSPIICKIYNAEGASDYAAGFPAAISVNEESDLARFLPFGDPNELMLATALSAIDGNQQPEETTQGLKTTLLHSSITCRASRAVMISK